MKKIVAFLVLALINAFHVVTAMEPSIVLVTTEKALVYRTNDGQAELMTERPAKYAPDNTQQGQSLQELADRRRLEAAYVANFLDCGQDVIAKESLEEWIRRELASTADDGGRIRHLVAKPVNDSYIMVSGQEGERAVVLNRETGQRLPGSPCGVAVKFVRLSPGGKRIAFVAEELRKITFFGGNGSMFWDPHRSGKHFIQLQQLHATNNPVTTSTITEAPLDLMLPDEGNWWFLVARHSNGWWNPANWLEAVGGHGTRRSEISLLTYDSSGQLLSSRHVASGVVLVVGRLVPSE